MIDNFSNNHDAQIINRIFELEEDTNAFVLYARGLDAYDREILERYLIANMTEKIDLISRYLKDGAPSLNFAIFTGVFFYAGIKIKQETENEKPKQKRKRK